MMRRTSDGAPGNDLTQAIIAPISRWLSLLSAVLALVACGQSAVRPLAVATDSKLPRPSRILLSAFVINHRDVNEYQGILRQQPANPNAVERQNELAKLAASVFTAELAKGLRQLGFQVDQAYHSGKVANDDLLIDGQFVKVDEGDPLRRLTLGFGSGAAKMETQARVYQGAVRRKILEFITITNSGKFPGVVATGPAAVAVPVSVSVGLTGARAVGSGPSSVGDMAAASADQAVRFLSEFFARQNWIDAKQAKKARIGY
jgi:hypothetical protein